MRTTSNRWSWGAALVVAIMLLGPTRAYAYVVPGTPQADRIVIGNYFAFFAQRPMACVDTAGVATYYPLGPLGGSLDELVIVNAGGGNDTVTILRTAQAVPGACAVSGGAQWYPLSYGTQWVEVNGDADADHLSGGTGPTYLHGGNQNDILHYYSTTGWAQGGSGNDDLNGHSGTRDYLLGGTGNDCLMSSANSGHAAAGGYYSCGADLYDLRYAGQIDSDGSCEGSTWSACDQ